MFSLSQIRFFVQILFLFSVFFITELKTQNHSVYIVSCDFCHKDQFCCTFIGSDLNGSYDWNFKFCQDFHLKFHLTKNSNPSLVPVALQHPQDVMQLSPYLPNSEPPESSHCCKVNEGFAHHQRYTSTLGTLGTLPVICLDKTVQPLWTGEKEKTGKSITAFIAVGSAPQRALQHFSVN